MPIPLPADHVIERLRSLDGAPTLIPALTGRRLPAAEAHRLWPRILEHKWYMSERLGRDVGLKVAAIDYLDNVQPRPARPRLRVSGRWAVLPAGSF